jgi:hypothetical protein
VPATPVKKELPTPQEFVPRFIRNHAVANQLKPSGIAHKEIVLRVHLVPPGDRKLDAISNADVQQLIPDPREVGAHGQQRADRAQHPVEEGHRVGRNRRDVVQALMVQ